MLGHAYAAPSPDDSSLRAFADDLRGETVVGSGHFIPEEQPEALARLFDDFFAKH